MKLVDLKAAFLTLMFVGGYGSIIAFFTYSPCHGAAGFAGTVLGCFLLGRAIGRLSRREKERNPYWDDD